MTPVIEEVENSYGRMTNEPHLNLIFFDEKQLF